MLTISKPFVFLHSKRLRDGYKFFLFIVLFKLILLNYFLSFIVIF